MGFRLIAVDVDGTLLRSDGSISERTRTTLARAVDRGASLAVATGRRRRTALPIMHRLGVPHYLVASQGATTWYEDEIIAHAHLPVASARRAIELLDSNGHFGIIFGNSFQPEAIWVTGGDWRANPRVAQYLLRGERGDAPVPQNLGPDGIEHDPIEIIVFDDMDRLEALNEHLTGHTAPPPALDPPLQDDQSRPQPLWRVIFSRNQFTAGGAIEIVGPDTSKAHALAALCDRLGCTPAEVIAFGDNVNDLEMLNFAGLGVCMANGTPEARAAAGRVCPSNDEDGIAVTLEELGLA
ncbi:MAG: HMP-PP hydrolase (pyridoxal phosphatase) Cof, detected in genetic screen for thiamin metabolic genes (PMID:15292217) [uncultured Chloroflexi bacterium]|uniref:HMP-PP hydrolase (Pyridoxal phosphatase) Cof, detected in genetic screen for thiamin metabolic genes (PMID:15292217) n=1 Tax=uncultured Chloroflexota bacterium TaxID=166587 RepID=A0A6J4IDW8_9CHLR|nr:MAG: HMP-PP hydrolase (pyridoxal phosphatase) Cof, detected in genetic screen for thiamin metabolic genes (PMID:15292217) [uncultured Chloroflexota bacterium]